MKYFLVNLFLTLAALTVLIVLGSSKFNKSQYISKKVLDITTPVGVTIDTQTIKSLSPAYEQQ